MEKSNDVSEEIPISRKQIAWRLLKFLMFICCFTGFTYQASLFFTNFFEYPTVINVSVDKRSTFIAPAFTFCYTSQFKRSRYCSTYPDNCEVPKEPDFCEEKPHYCRKNTTNILIPKNEYLQYENYYKRNNTEELCEYKTPFINDNSSSRLYFAQTRNRYGTGRFLTYPCFAKYSRLESRFQPKMKSLNKTTSVFLYDFKLDPRDEEMFDPSATPGVLFSIHSPYEPINPYIQGNVLVSGKSYKIHLKLEEDRLLPRPYKTDCIDYEALWSKRNNSGPRSRLMCMEICQRIYSQSCRKCLWGLSIYKSPNEMCEMDKGERCTVMFGKIKNYPKRTACMDSCKQECVKMRYTYTIEERANIPTVDDVNGEGYIDIDVFVDKPEVLLYSYKPQYMEVEAFSYIGGFMGCWLGVSIWAFAGSVGQTLVNLALKTKKYLTTSKEINFDVKKENSPAVLSDFKSL